MPISFSMIVLSSHLVFAVADQVPKFDIARSCKLDAAAAATISERQPIKKCADDEQQAQQQLASQWSSFPAASRARCSGMEAIGDAPSYVSLLTCPVGKITPRYRFIDQGLSGMRASRSGALEICIRPANG